MDDSTSTAAIMNEIMHKRAYSPVALRSDRAYVEQLNKLEKDNRETEAAYHLEDGAVLITGGTGGLGLEVGKYMAESGARVFTF